MTRLEREQLKISLADKIVVLKAALAAVEHRCETLEAALERIADETRGANPSTVAGELIREIHLFAREALAGSPDGPPEVGSERG